MTMITLFTKRDVARPVERTLPDAAGTVTISIVTPTKNRPKDLAAALRSVLAQTLLPIEIIVVDQSEDRESEAAVKREIEAVVSRDNCPNIHYVRDPAIAGANAARNVGMKAARGEIIAIIEDDIVLEPLALQRLLEAYDSHPHMLGMSGTITNYPPPSLAVRVFNRLFSLGPFHDDRQPLYWRWQRYPPTEVVPISRMGGLLTFRARAVTDLEFDTTPKVLRVRGEDRDFCFVVAGQTGGGRRVFGMAMGARLTHNPSPVGRHRGRAEELDVVSQHYFYSRHLRGSAVNTALYAWWNIGIGLYAVMAASYGRHLEPIRSLVRGWRLIRDGYLRPGLRRP